MGVYLNGVRKGLQEWHESPAANGAKSMDGFDDLYSKFMTDDDFTMSVVKGAEEIGTNFMGYVTPDAMEKFLGGLDDVATKYGGSYKPLIAEYEENPEGLLSALKDGDMDYVNQAYASHVTPDLNGGVVLSSDPNDPAYGELFAGNQLINASDGREVTAQMERPLPPEHIKYTL